jgi:hypothetical protein
MQALVGSDCETKDSECGPITYSTPRVTIARPLIRREAKGGGGRTLIDYFG